MSGVPNTLAPPPDWHGTPRTAWSRRLKLGGGPIGRFILQRVGTGILTLFLVSILIFMATNALPGNVAQVVLGKSATQAQTAALETRLGLNEPLITRYLHWLQAFAHGDMGQSATQLAQGAQSAPVSDLVWPAIRNSLVIAVLAAVVLLPLAMVMGTWAASRRDTLVDYTVSYIALVLGSLPEFVLGTLLIVVFFTQLGWLPPVVLVRPGGSPLDQPDALVLPVLTLLGVALAFCARQVRANVVETLGEDYSTMARLNGVRERRVLSRYALRNALAPCVQTFAQAIQYLFGGIIVVEALFDYPGVGNLLVGAVQARDVTLVQAIALVLATSYIAINIVADLAVMLLVPKLRTASS